jgi:Tfp pilus assembly protein PilP
VIFVALAVVVAVAEPLYAQALAPAAAVNVPQTPSEAYTYKPDGRRDPFVSLVGTGAEPRATGKRGDGLGAFGVGEIAVRGVLQSRSALVAMVQGPDNKTYLIHTGDKLADGVVKRVTPEGIVVVQQVSDPRSTEKQREVRKLLRSLEDVKE